MIHAPGCLQLFHTQSSILRRHIRTKMLAGIILVLLATSLCGQSSISSFGVVTMSDLSMPNCSFDKSAAAMFLLDKQTVRVEEMVGSGGFKTITTKRSRIKIFKKEGFEFAATKITYSKSRQTRISDIEAFLHYLDNNGQIVTVKLTEKDLFRNKSKKGFSTISFTFSEVREGCVVELQYVRTDKNSVRTKPWILQNEIPTLFTEYTLDLPDFIPMKDRMVTNVLKVESKTDTIKEGILRKNRFRKTYWAKDLPVFKMEPYMSSVKDNLERVEFNLGSTGFLPVSSNADIQWTVINDMFNSPYFIGGMKNNEIAGTKALVDSAKKINKVSERIHFVLNKIQTRIKWDEELSFYPEDINNAWKSGTGNSAEMNMILINILQKSGVDVYPLLTSSRENGKIDKAFPSVGQFDGLQVLAVDTGINYILDAKEQYLSYTATPSSIANREALLINNHGGAWVSIEETRPLIKTISSIQANLNEDGLITGMAIVSSFDYAKVQQLSMTREEQEKERNSKTKIRDNDFTLTIDSSIIENENNNLLPLKQTLYFTYEPSVSDPFYFIAPSFLSSFRKTPFTDTIRLTNIDFTSAQYYLNTMNLIIPENFEIAELPKNIFLRTVDSSISYSCQSQVEENSISIRSVFEIKRPEYDKEEYPAIRAFFEKITGLIRELIVIKKKSKTTG
jgi:Domain of Unknown Function with PDB structure (DUF3857)